MADRTVKVTLSAQVQGYVAGMREAAQATRDTGTQAEKLAQQSQAFETMGRAGMVAGGAIVAGFGLATKAAIDWDSAWAGVTKTVDGSPEQLAAVEEGLRGLTAVLPASHTEIAAVAEAAGQLGIKTPDVVEFTRTMIDLGETTNLSSEAAATSLARFMTVMGTAQSEVSGLGSALVDLGNNYATTEAEIMAMAMRLAGAGTQIGMTEGEVLGLSTALSSVGIEAEAGGSAMSKVMIDIASSVEKGGDRLTQFADVAGVSAEKFAAQWRNDPGEALAAFVKGLANAEAQGKSTFGILEELGITEVRMRDALLRSSSAADQFSDAMKQGNAALKENTALTDEAEKRYETTAAKLGIMKNRVVDSAISIGEHFLPAVEAVAEGVGGFADALSGLDGPMGAVVAWGGLVAGGILLTGGMALAAVPKIAAYKVAMETLNISGGAVRGKLGGIASFLGGPWGIAMGLATVSTAAFNNAMDNSKTSAQEFENAIKQGESALDAMASKANQNETGITSLFVDVSQHFANLPALADKAATAGRGFWSSMSFNENAALDSIRNLGDGLAKLASTDLPQAQEAFANWVKDSGLNDTQALTFLNEEMVGFKSALIDAAEAAGVATDDATLLEFALGRIKPATADATDGVEAQDEALKGLEDTAATTQAAVSALADEISGFGQAQFDTREANRRLQESFAELGAELEKNGANFDITTEGGRAVEAALDGVARNTNVAAAAMVEAGASQDEVNAKLSEGKNALIDILAPYMGSRDAAASYVEQLGLISPEKVTDIIENAAAAKSEVEGYKDSLGGIPGEKNTKVNADTDTAQSNLSSFITTLNSIPSLITTRVQEIREKIDSGSNADGGVYAYANGGFGTGIYKGGTPIHKFAEPETIWEAYISGKPDQRDRNRQIWVEAGDRLGMGEILKSLATIGSGGGGVNVQQTINAQPGMSETEIARISADGISFAFKGV